jgi:hypothetical protein
MEVVCNDTTVTIHAIDNVDEMIENPMGAERRA